MINMMLKYQKRVKREWTRTRISARINPIIFILQLQWRIKTRSRRSKRGYDKWQYRHLLSCLPTCLLARLLSCLLPFSLLFPSLAVAPKGLMTYAFTRMGDFFLLLLFYALPSDSNPSFKAEIPASRSKSQPGGPNPSLKAQIPVLGLKD